MSSEPQIDLRLGGTIVLVLQSDAAHTDCVAVENPLRTTMSVRRWHPAARVARALLVSSRYEYNCVHQFPARGVENRPPFGVYSKSGMGDPPSRSNTGWIRRDAGHWAEISSRHHTFLFFSVSGAVPGAVYFVVSELLPIRNQVGPTRRDDEEACKLFSWTIRCGA